MTSRGRPARSGPAAAIAVIIVMGLTLYVISLFCLRSLAFNPTHSAPPGLYVRVATVSLETPPGYSTPDYHRLVAFPVPTTVANWVARHLPLARGGFLKPVIGLAGDEICFIPGQGYFRNGMQFSDPLPAMINDSTPLPAWTGCQVLGAEEVFVYSARIPNSFDSRSYGPVPVGSLFGVYDPLWTW